VARVHADGRKLFVFTVNEPSDMERLEQMGVDGIFTDFPDRQKKL
jgi:glycerophosphoryl diester phosphodiesterase